MRKVEVDGEKYFVFQDVCRDLSLKVCFADVRRVRESNKRYVKLATDRPKKDNFIVLNAAGVTELLEIVGRTTKKSEVIEMNAIVKLETRQMGDDSIQTVNARELHTFLENKAQFADWIKERIEQFGFTQGVDFIQFHQKMNNSVKPRTEYALTLDMAKELSMVERNEKGKQARQYFIECERRAKSQPLVPQTLPEALRLAADLAEKITERDKLISVIQPHSEALHKISLADGSLCLTDAAKTLGVQPQKVLIPYLKANKWIYYRTGCAHPVAYQDKLQQMLLEHKVTTVSRGDGSEKVTEQVRVTPKGLTKLALIFLEAI